MELNKILQSIARIEKEIHSIYMFLKSQKLKDISKKGGKVENV